MIMARGFRREEKTPFSENSKGGSKENATPGVGLGLAISKAVMKAHGGSIEGESRYNGGAPFYIEAAVFLSPGYFRQSSGLMKNGQQAPDPDYRR